MCATAQAGRPSNLLLSVRSWLPGRFKLPTAWLDVSNPFGVDVSEYQGSTNPVKLRERGVRFAGIRASIGLRADVRFAENWEKFKAAGIYRFAYHALRPDLNLGEQAALFHRTIGSDKGEIPPAWDVERRDSQTNDMIANKTWSGLRLSSDWYGGAAILYSSAYYANLLIGPRAWFNDFWWWLAHYLYANPITGYAEEHPGPVALPTGVDRAKVLIHQTAGKGRGGAEWGVDSLNLDYDRWQFDLAHLRAYAGELPVPALTLEQLEQRVKRLERAVFP